MLPDPAPPRNDRTEGERRRATGTARAAANRPLATLQLQLRILELARTGITFTIDDLSSPDERDGAFPNRGPYRGAAFLAVAGRKLIRQTGERRKSNRRHRHAGKNPVWQSCAPPELIDAEIAAVREGLAAVTEPTDDGGTYAI